MFETRGDDDDSVVNDDSDNATGGEMLGLQLAEFEMLMSMYSNVNELQCDDPAAIVDIQNVVDGTTKYDQLKSRIRFTLKICTDDAVSLRPSTLHPHKHFLCFSLVIVWLDYLAVGVARLARCRDS